MALIHEKGVGALTLDWLWSDERVFFSALNHHLEFFDTICYFLVAEGLENHVVVLLKAQNPTSSKVDYRWRKMVLRSLIKAKLEFANTNMDEALKFFFSIRKDIHGQRREMPNR